jgi:hypothetical protein
MSTIKDIPSGYRKDAKGRLVPEEIIPPVDLLRDELVTRLAQRVETVSAAMSAVKAGLLADVAEHIALVASEYGVTLSGTEGNIVLVSYDGTRKIERAVAERITVGEEINAAEALIREILDEINDPSARAIVDRSFRRNHKTGELSHARLIDLVSVDIDDDRWRRAVKAIKDALEVQGSTTYFRAYKRAKSDEPWEQITLDFSRLTPADPLGAQAPEEIA